MLFLTINLVPILWFPEHSYFICNNHDLHVDDRLPASTKYFSDCDGDHQASFRGNCYSFFVNNTEHTLTFDNANLECLGLDGAHLVSIESPEEQAFLEQEMMSRKGDKTKWRFWTSGEGKYDRWKWISGK
jgi:hypothetical protein